MKAFLKKHKRAFTVFGLLLVLVCLLEIWWVTAGIRGTWEARFDIWRGHYAVQSYGLNVYGREYAQLLKERYGIRTHIVAFCLVSEDERAYADNYNKLSAAAAKQKFGHDVFTECFEDAKIMWEQKVASAKIK